MLGKPGISARPMPAITSRMDGATSSRRAKIATATSTASSRRRIWIVSVMDEAPRAIIQGLRAQNKGEDRTHHGHNCCAVPLRSGAFLNDGREKARPSRKEDLQ